jgi:FkbM family methyltransferase
MLYSCVPRSLYTAIADTLNWSYAARCLGLRQTLHFKWVSNRKNAAQQDGTMITLKASNLLHPFSVRAGTTDVRTFLYSVAREAYGRYFPAGSVRYILDAGANIGDTSVWFLTRFPDAQVVAVEPDADNFDILAKNSAPYGKRLHLMRAGLWPKRTQLTVKTTQTEDGVQTVESADGSCAAIPIQEVMEQYEFPHLDIFKCDIEGAELQLFSEDCDFWLSRTRFIVIEVHGPDCLNAVLASTSRHGFSHRRFRDLHIFERQPENSPVG